MRSCVCPACGANLDVRNEERAFLFCEYCGTKIMLDDYRETHRIIDEAKVREIEANERLQTRLLDQDEKDDRLHRTLVAGGFIVSALMAVAGITLAAIGEGEEWLFLLLFALLAAMFTGIFASESGDKRQERKNRRRGLIQVHSEMTDCAGKQYKAVEAILRSVGFRDITAINLGDMGFLSFQRAGAVDTVTIDGKSFSAGKWYPPDGKIVIAYHGKPE